MEQISPQVMHRLVFTVLMQHLPDSQSGAALQILTDALKHTQTQVRELAARLANQDWVESLRIDHVANRAVVAVHKPLELYSALAEWSAMPDILEIAGLQCTR